MKRKIQFATDFVCPYCYAAEIPLRQALEGRDDVEVELLPIELTPVSKEPVDTYHDEVRRAKWAKDLIPFCEKLGLDAHFPPKVIPRPYTHLAWQGWHYAVTKNRGEAYAEVMYRAYFTDERDIGDLDVLSDIAEALGLDRAEFRSVLEAGTFSALQDEAVRRTREMGVKGVPTIWIDGVQLTADMFTKDDFAYYLDEADEDASISFGEGSAAAAAEGGPAAFHGCGPDGC